MSKHVWVRTRYIDHSGEHEIGDEFDYEDDTEEQKEVLESLCGSGILSLEKVDPVVTTPPDYVPPEWNGDDGADEDLMAAQSFDAHENAEEVEVVEVTDGDEGHHSDEHVG